MFEIIMKVILALGILSLILYYCKLCKEEHNLYIKKERLMIDALLKYLVK